MSESLLKRPDKKTHFFNRARVAAEMSTCLRRKVGVIITKDGVEVSSGYVGSPRGAEHCTDRGKCMRIELGVPSGERYELCRSVHAEQNAILNAARTGMNILGAVMYIYSARIPDRYRQDSSQQGKVYGPCMICKKEIINVGLVQVHMNEEGVGIKAFNVTQLREMLDKEEKSQQMFRH
ncbi:cytidine/deoxycytidylate deaminase family protein [Chloroflexota bacterium]